MKSIKKIVCILMITALILTSMPLSFISSAAGSVQADASLVLNRPQASVIVTEVTRVAYQTNSMKAPSGNNSVIVQSTPSGIPYLSSTRRTLGYAGETPVSTTIVFTPGVELEETPVLSCTNSTVKWTGPVYSNGTYTWTVTGGTAMSGTNLVFDVRYVYSEVNPITGITYTHTYYTSGTSYVEPIATPAGLYSVKRTYSDWVVGTTTQNRSYLATYMLGKNTYGSIYDNGEPDGSVAFATSAWADGASWTDEYGMMQKMDDSDANRDYNISYKVDSNRAMSTVYFDKSINSTLSDLNLRTVTAVMNQASESDERVTVTSKDTYVLDGFVASADDSDEELDLTSDSIQAAQLNVTKPTGSLFGIASNFTSYFTGAGPVSDNTTADYTVVYHYQTAAGWNDVRVSHAYNLRIVTYNKGALRTLVENIQSTDPTVMITGVPSGDYKGYNPQYWYFSSGWEAFSNALNAARSCLDKPNVTQSEIDAAYQELSAAYENLEMQTADYTIAGAYYNQAINKNPNNYTLASWAKLQTLLDSYRPDYSVLYQPAVDKMGADLKAAMDALEERYADYSEFNALLSTVNTLERRALTVYGRDAAQVYSGWSNLVSVLTKSGCSYNDLDGYTVEDMLLISDQAKVDGYVLLVERALNALGMASADYTNATKAESAYRVINKNYVVSDIEVNLTEAYNNLVALHGLDITHQSEINMATSTLNYWLDQVEYKPADTAAAQELLNYAYGLDRSLYSDFSGVDTAIDNLLSKLDLDIRYQSEINRAVSALQSAIDKLLTNSADYSLVDEAIEAVADRERLIIETYEDSYGFTAETFYANWNTVTTAIGNVVRGLDVTKQTQVDNYATAINNALAGLRENTADYSQVTEIQNEAYNLCTSGSSLYTEASINRLLGIYMGVTANLPISQQTTVDGFVVSIRQAIDELEFLPANYSSVNTQLDNANAKIAADEAYSQAHPGYTLYTNESLANVYVAIAEVVDGLDIRYQTTVNGYATDISNAVNALEYAPADYTAVYEALAAVPADTSIYTTLSLTTLNTVIKGINYTYTADKQASVDKYVTNINNAIGKLKLKSASYTAVNAAISAVPTNASLYTEDSWQALQDQLNAVVTGYDITRQSEVDKMAENINTALSLLAYKSADYTNVNNAKTQIPADLSIYTEESINALNKALDDVDYYCNITQQTTVDAYASAITKAIAGLKEISANYDAVTEAINAANAKIDTGLYTDDSVTAVQNAIDAVVNGYGITKQAEVTAMAEAINTAVSAMQYKNADYSAVDTAIENANAKINSGLYTDESVSDVQEKINAVVTDYDITKQAEVTAMAEAINTAASAMQYKNADYSNLNSAIENAEVEIAKGWYTDDSVAALNSEIEKVTYNLDVTHQLEVNNWTDNIVKATKDLTKKLADYTELQKILNLLDNSTSEIYTISYINFDEVMASINDYRNNSVKMDITIDRQSEVEEMVSMLQGLIDSLVPAPTEMFAFTDSVSIRTVGNVNYVYGFRTSMTDSQLKNGGYYEAENVTVATERSSSRYLGTGSKITVTYGSGKTEEYIIIIFGDLDGNAKIDTSDAMYLADALTGESAPLTDAEKLAANVYGSGSRITVNDQDYNALCAVAAGEMSIDQSTGKAIEN